MAKVPGPYYPLHRDGAGDDNPPPYSEIEGSAIAPPGALTSPVGFANEDNSLRARAAPQSYVSTEAANEPAVVHRGVPLASKSIDVVCPHCQANIRTSIEKRPGLLAYLSGAIMACLCCFCGCCLIPCCIDECMEVKHTCPVCEGLVGKYRL